MFFFILFCACFVVSAIAQSDKTTCLALNSGTTVATYYRGSCYVYKAATKTYDDAKTSCNDLKNGHLVMLTEDDFIDLLRDTQVRRFSDLFHNNSCSHRSTFRCTFGRHIRNSAAVVPHRQMICTTYSILNIQMAEGGSCRLG